MPVSDPGQADVSLLAVAFAAGVGLFLGGVANTVLGRARPWARAAGSAVACSGAAVGVWAAAGSAASAAAGGGFAAVGLALAAPRRPGARWAVAGAAGLVLAVGAVVWHGAAEDADDDQAQAELLAAAQRPPTRPAPVPVFTDRGTRVGAWQATRPRSRAELAALEVRPADTPAVAPTAIRSYPADDRSNCHGWVFTRGRYWVSETDVDVILAENGYRAVPDPRPSDLAIYRADGVVTHTAVVRYVSPGMPVLVEGKWGPGPVYLHAADESGYGTDITYYRADRTGHVLAGLDSHPSADAPVGGQ
ncbi:hypothetical protein [Urbifossiella limnaea]|uniref:Uncharacterized protein n=1 Tax=Urbifossiella limnaea TaxID=2528023 RepID=A0A517Y2E1_9BACT|nr:hypothetical protein [Urbifossiella limnaea]QDU23894.1 hypothetical protein ETAA1_59040 [Urbifossiella limnaea]